MKILVTGSNGLVGYALKQCALHDTKNEWIFSTKSTLNLLDREWTFHYVKSREPDAIIHTAARVGGIMANMKYPAQYFSENIQMNTNIIDAAAQYKVNKLLAFSSVCAYPNSLLPLIEDRMHEGPPHEAHFGYAYAKRMVDVAITAYKKEDPFKDWCTITPVNIYGPNDYYNIETGHIIPSLIRKADIASTTINKTLKVWGDGTPTREFMYSMDVAAILIELLHLDIIPSRLILSNGIETSIKNVANIIASEYRLGFEFDTKMPNGQINRPTDSSRLKELLPNIQWTRIEDGLKWAIEWYNQNKAVARV